jgi:hypothetical protein
MQIYEIRVLDDDGKTMMIASEVELNDSAAIRSAKEISGKNKFEVWRGMHCVYGIEPSPVPKRLGSVR